MKEWNEEHTSNSNKQGLSIFFKKKEKYKVYKRRLSL